MIFPVLGKAVDYYENNNWSAIRSHADLRRIIAKYPNTKKSNTLLANYLWDNNHWSRAKLLRELVKYFESQNIRGFKSLKRWIKTAQFEDIEGLVQVRDSKTGKVIHSIGPVLFEWLRLRLGEKTVIGLQARKVQRAPDSLYFLWGDTRGYQCRKESSRRGACKAAKPSKVAQRL